MEARIVLAQIEMLFGAKSYYESPIVSRSFLHVFPKPMEFALSRSMRVCKLRVFPHFGFPYIGNFREFSPSTPETLQIETIQHIFQDDDRI